MVGPPLPRYSPEVGFRTRHVLPSSRAPRFPRAATKGHMTLARTTAPGGIDISTEVRHAEALLQTGALQSAIFSSIATDAKGVIQIFNVGTERMLGYAAADVVNKITPADISDPQEV